MILHQYDVCKKIYWQWVVHDVRLNNVLDTVVIYGDDVCYSVVFDTLVGVFVFSVM